MIRLSSVAVIIFALCTCLTACASSPGATKPNVLFIAMDDLNDWIGCMGGHPQTKTPNLDRLAKSGMLFTNAHCAAPACNPSRSAIFTGIAPNRSGIYDNAQKLREILPNAVLLPQHFRNHGYAAMGSGKMLHYFIDAQSWDTYFPEKSTENPFPQTFNPPHRPISLPVGGPWQYVETDWAALDVSDEQCGGDWLVSKWVGEQLSKQHDKPFFLACGIYRPHEPWFVPKEYFEPFPLEEIELPPGYLESDLDDLPPAGKQAGPNRYFAHIQAQGKWREAVQAYLASIHYADAMLGRVLDALESGPNADNTIVVLWSDHGWHLGEKQHWQKYTAWRACTRVPLILRVPQNVCKNLSAGTQPGSECTAPVNLLSLFPTLTDLCGVDASPVADGPSLLPLLENNSAEWPHASVTYLGKPGSYGLSTATHRYIHYANGDEEMYSTTDDPFEWHNLAGEGTQTALLEQLRSQAPTFFEEKQSPSIESLVELDFHPATTEPPPASQPDGSKFPVYFSNQRPGPVELCWMTRKGAAQSYGRIETGKRKRQTTRPGAVWLIRDATTGQEIGHFVVGDRSAQAIVSQ